MTKYDSINILNNISKALGIEVNWNENDACSFIEDDRMQIILSQDKDIDNIMFLAKIGELSSISQKKQEEYKSRLLMTNLMGATSVGGNIGVDTNNIIMFSWVLSGVSYIDPEFITEDIINTVIDAIGKEIDLFEKYQK